MFHLTLFFLPGKRHKCKHLEGTKGTLLLILLNPFKRADLDHGLISEDQKMHSDNKRDAERSINNTIFENFLFNFRCVRYVELDCLQAVQNVLQF